MQIGGGVAVQREDAARDVQGEGQVAQLVSDGVGVVVGEGGVEFPQQFDTLSARERGDLNLLDSGGGVVPRLVAAGDEDARAACGGQILLREGLGFAVVEDEQGGGCCRPFGAHHFYLLLNSTRFITIPPVFLPGGGNGERHARGVAEIQPEDAAREELPVAVRPFGSELGFARLLRMIASARTLVHTQPVQGTMEQVLGAFAPAHVRGYQAPAAFEQAARQMLQRSRAVGLVHSLVHLQLLPRIAHVDALKACRVLRNGDLVTADAQGLQLFLFACTPSDVPYALNNMFALPLEQLFAAQTVDSSEVGIAHALQQLRTQAARLPDYTVALQAAAAAVVDLAVEPAAAPVVAAAPAAMTLLPPMAPPPPQTEPAAQSWRAHPIGRRSTKILESSV